MLNFTKIKVLSIYLIFIFFASFSLLNFQNNKQFIIDKKINLGLDLQGGSYLLLEIDTDPLIEERLQNKVILLKKFLKKNEFNYENFTIRPNSLNFEIQKNNLKKFEILFLSQKDNLLNSYIQK